MIEARVFVSNLDNARDILKKENAKLKGKYKIHDTIYRNVDKTVSLTDQFLRLRVVPENIWDEKGVILALKQTKLHKVGKALIFLLNFNLINTKKPKRTTNNI